MRRSRRRKDALPAAAVEISAAERRKARSLVRALLPWFRENARDLPWRRGRDPYAIWVSEVMLQQTQVATVIPYYERWMKALPDIRSLARVSSGRLHKLWEGLGYYTRVRNMQDAARRICREHGGAFPDQYDDVLALPGIGRYTAGAICSIAFHQPTAILDGNVVRVLTRVFGIDQDPRESETNARLWRVAEEMVKGAGWGGNGSRRRAGGVDAGGPECSHLNQGLMELGATLCRPRSPGCPACPVRRWCVAFREGLTQQLPAAGKRPRTIRRQDCVVVVQRRDRFLALKRDVGRVNGGLWEFPTVQDVRGEGVPSKIAGVRIHKPAELGALKHSVTRYRITARVYLARASTPGAAGGGDRRWFTRAELERLPMSAVHRRIATTYLDRNGETPEALPSPPATHQ